MTALYWNGRPATLQDLAVPALRNDGHFTTFQLRERAVLGLDLHLQRLDEASRALFGLGLDADRVRQSLRAAVVETGTRDATVRITVVPRAVDARVSLDLLVALSPPAEPGVASLRLRSFVFQRDTPAIKHVGTFAQFQRQRLARQTGADDALFVDGQGRVVEGSVWNLGLWDGVAVIWPQGDALRGTRERLLQAGLAALGVPQAVRPVMLAELDAGMAAFTCNARGQQLIGDVDGRAMTVDPGLLALLDRALGTQPRTLVA